MDLGRASRSHTGTHPLHSPGGAFEDDPRRCRRCRRRSATSLCGFARVPRALKDLPGMTNRKPHQHPFSRGSLEEAYAWAKAAAPELYGPWASSPPRACRAPPERMGRRDPDPNVQAPVPGTHAIRRRAFIAGLDTTESPEDVVGALKDVPAKALSLVLPWAHKAQPLVLKALGLEAAEGLRAWLLNHAGGDPAYAERHGAFLENSPDPAAMSPTSPRFAPRTRRFHQRARPSLRRTEVACSPPGTGSSRPRWRGRRAKLIEAATVKSNSRRQAPRASSRERRRTTCASAIPPAEGSRRGEPARRAAAGDAARGGGGGTRPSRAGGGLRRCGPISSGRWSEPGAGPPASFAPRTHRRPRGVDRHREPEAAPQGAQRRRQVLASVPSALKKHPEHEGARPRPSPR